MSESSRYQFRILEIGMDIKLLHNYSNEQGCASYMEINTIDPYIKDLQNELIRELRVLISTQLTPHQEKVINLVFEGWTQQEIAAELGITQSAVHKAIHGNIDYKNNKKRYGGAVTKLKKLCRNHRPILIILNNIENAKREMKDLPPIPLILPLPPLPKPKPIGKKRKNNTANAI